MEGIELQKIFKDYIVELDDMDNRLIEYNVETKGPEGYVNSTLDFIDIGKRYSTSKMITVQTIDFTYKRFVTMALYVIEHFFNNDEAIVNKLIDIHNKNLEFEESHPPVIYKKKAKSKAPKEKKEPKEKPIKNKIKDMKLVFKFK